MMGRTHTVILLSLTISLALFVGSCGPPPKPAIVPGPGIPNLNLTGEWDSQPFGLLKLKQDGRLLTGSYTDPRGPDHDGTIRGKVEGDLVRVQWIKQGNDLTAVQTVQGRAWLRVKRGGKFLEGRFGYDEEEEGAGPWTAEKSEYR